MTQVNLNEVKSRLSHYARLVKAGETIILCERNKPFAEIRPIGTSVSPLSKRPIGLMPGWFPVPDDFNAPNSELEHIMETTPIFPSVP